MTFRTQWLDEFRILHTTFEGSTSVSELNLVMLEYLGVAQAQDAYFLLDFSDVSVPNNMLKLPSLVQVINHGNTKWLCIVKADSGVSYMTKLLTGNKVKIFRSTKDATSFLRGMVRLETRSDLDALV